MKQIYKTMKEGIDRTIFPGAVLLIAHQGNIVFHEAFGASMIVPQQHKMTCNTYFDLASLTKPLVTTTALALLLYQGLIDLNDPLVKYIPLFKGGGKEDVTLFHLLSHCSGLRAWRPYYKNIFKQDKIEKGFLGSVQAKQAVFQMAHQEPIITRPGQRSRYSDIGFILLGEVIEKVSQMPLDLFFNRHIRAASKSSESFFLPLHQKASASFNFPFAATEDSNRRKEMILGVVHDDNSYAMGGVSGHSGLFSTAMGLYQLACIWIDSLKGFGLIDLKIATTFITKQEGEAVPIGSSRALGWDTPSHPKKAGGRGVSSSGHYFSPSSFGHLGFTGTSVWVDRKAELIVILLSNRVHPSSKNVRIREFRPLIHDVIFKAIVGV